MNQTVYVACITGPGLVITASFLNEESAKEYVQLIIKNCMHRSVENFKGLVKSLEFPI